MEREAWSCATQQLGITLPTDVARALLERVTSALMRARVRSGLAFVIRPRATCPRPSTTTKTS